MIEVEGLSKRFQSFEAVKGVTFHVGEGEIFGFLGPNGAGKSTTIKMLSTLLRPSGGSARLNGYDVVRRQAQVRRSIGIVFQDPSLDDRMTGEENLRLHAALYALPRAGLDKRIDTLLEMVELSDRGRDMVRTYSGGMKRRLEIARGLLHRPRVLFLDEPTIGLDPQTRARIWSYIRGLRDREGVTIFMTTHYMDEAENCDRIAVIDHGEIVALDSPARLKAGLGGSRLRVRAGDPEAAARILAEDLGLEPQVRDGEIWVTVQDGESIIPEVVRRLQNVEAISLYSPSLDDVFLELTGRDIRDEGPESPMSMMRRWR